MGPVGRALVGVAVVCASAQAFAESAPPRQQAAPQQAPRAPAQPKAPAKAAPTKQQAPTKAAPTTGANTGAANTATNTGAKTAAPRGKQPRAPRPKAPPSPTLGTRASTANAADNAAQVPKAGDGAGVGSRCTVAPVRGTPIFEARYLAGRRAIITRLYASGTFTRVALKQSPTTTACIEQAQLDGIVSALAEAPWQATKSPATCAGTATETTEIYAAGKLRFTSRTCNPLVLDKLSSRVLDLVAFSVGPFGLDLADEIVEGN
jgi:hypothetical protein